MHFLIARGRFQISLFLGQLGKLAQEPRVARVGRQQPLELGPGAAHVARRRMGLRHAHRHVAAARFRSRPSIVAFLMLQPRKEPVELAALEIKLRQLLDHVELVIELVGPVKRPPVHLDRFVGLILAGQRLGQPEHDAALIRIGTNRPAQGIEPLLRPAQAEAELGKELVAFRVARCSREQVSTRLQCRLDPPQPGLEPGHTRQMLDAIAAIDLGKPTQSAAAASPRLPADSRSRAASVHAGTDRGSISMALSAARTASGSLPSASR